MKKAAFHNLGCKVNAYETEAMQELLEKSGYEIVPFTAQADVYIINTCTVTNMADRKSRQMLHRAKKMNPNAVIVAAGCYVQAKGKERKKEIDSCVDIVIGNNRKKDIAGILAEYEVKRASTGCMDGKNEFFNADCVKGQAKFFDAGCAKRQEELLDIAHVKDYEELTLACPAERTRAYIKVQDGCNQFCSYCIIPYVRGRVRSRRSEAVLEEARVMASGGYKEIVLTGIHLSSYGMDTGEDLLSLIRKVHSVEGIKRIRLGSLEPGIITEEFAEALGGLSKLCPHFHLSLQSGCDETLKRMNRRYTAEEYKEKCRLLRKYFKRPALTTDVIVGFPGETEEEFEASKAFIDSIDFYETHIFKYSKRAGTMAASMEGQIPEEIKAKRSNELITLGKKKRDAYEHALIGTVQEVLVEEAIEQEDGIYQAGHTKEYVKIGQKTEKNLINQIVNVEIANSLQIIH